MQVSSDDVKAFLLDVINQVNFPGKMAEFVAAVKAEVETADVRLPVRNFDNHPHHSIADTKKGKKRQ